MNQVLLLLVVALVAGGIVFGAAALLTGTDPGLAVVEPDGRAVALPAGRPLAEGDLGRLRFDVGLRGYRADQVDEAIGRLGYDLGYKQELISVLESEVVALREGRADDADRLREARLAAGGQHPAASDHEEIIDLDAEPELPESAEATGSTEDEGKR
ncbi:DivIVA domain-containing protein [Longispora albida]|uniref:DivIVA domain-containing protein n=1 Tax=Longispora albida TaxID=203523 RepID=UPI00035DC9A7|nr:DivIVA domain-containing protein [Longispora albida]